MSHTMEADWKPPPFEAPPPRGILSHYYVYTCTFDSPSNFGRCKHACSRPTRTLFIHPRTQVLLACSHTVCLSHIRLASAFFTTSTQDGGTNMLQHSTCHDMRKSSNPCNAHLQGAAPRYQVETKGPEGQRCMVPALQCMTPVSLL